MTDPDLRTELSLLREELVKQGDERAEQLAQLKAIRAEIADLRTGLPQTLITAASADD